MELFNANNFRVLANLLYSRAWALFVEKGIIAPSNDAILAEITGSVPWDEYWGEFTKAFPFRFFYSPRNQKDFFLQTLQSLHSYDEIMDDANDAADRIFDFLGSGRTTLDTPVDWHKDFKSGARWNAAFYLHTALAQPADHADIKIPWELGRFHFLAWLGKGYWVSRSRKYSAAFVALIEEWITANPFCRGVQWNNAMETGIRACNWVAGAAFFLDEPSIPPEFWRRMFAALWKHGIFIEHNLEITRRSGNHLIADYTGLIFIGNLFGNTVRGRRWFAQGACGIGEEILRQTAPDGVNYEKSIAYHRFVAEMCIDAMLLCKINHIPFPQTATQRIEKMCEFTMRYVRTDRSAPNIGDGDDGRLFRFRARENFNDHSALLSTAAVAFERGDFKAAAGAFSEDSLWLCGAAGMERFRAIAPAPMRGKSDFPTGGFYILHSPQAHCFIDAGELGKHGWGGHGHNDTFSFEFWLEEPFIIDSGTYCYLSEPVQRAKFRSTAAHNTVRVDATELAEFAGPFRIKKDLTNPKIITRTSTPVEEIIEMEHYAYTRLKPPATHKRKFVFNASMNRLAITDTLLGGGEHNVESFLHFAPDVLIELTEPRTLRATGKKNALTLVSSHAWEILPCEVSESYGVKYASTAARISASGELPVTIEMVIAVL